MRSDALFRAADLLSGDGGWPAEVVEACEVIVLDCAHRDGCPICRSCGSVEGESAAVAAGVLTGKVQPTVPDVDELGAALVELAGEIGRSARRCEGVGTEASDRRRGRRGG